MDSPLPHLCNDLCRLDNIGLRKVAFVGLCQAGLFHSGVRNQSPRAPLVAASPERQLALLVGLVFPEGEALEDNAWGASLCRHNVVDVSHVVHDNIKRNEQFILPNKGLASRRDRTSSFILQRRQSFLFLCFVEKTT